MPVFGSDNMQLGMVDRVEGNTIKLTRDDSGQHHWIPFDWVSNVDDRVHLDRPCQQAMQAWSATPVHEQAMQSGMGDIQGPGSH